MSKSDKISGLLIFNGKIIEKPDETTFAKLLVKNNDQFIILARSGSTDPIIWKRFARLRNDDPHDYFYLS